MPKVSDEHRAERRRQIANASLRCFARNGFDATSMADIIAESGLSAGAIYLHYSNKQDLVRFVVEDVLRSRSSDLLGIAALRPLPHPAEVIRTFIRGMMRELGGTPILIQVWAVSAREPELAAVAGGLMLELRRLYVEYFEAWFAQAGLTEAEATARAHAVVPVVLGICQGYIVQSAVVAGFDGEGYLAAVELIDFSASRAGSLGG